MPQFIIVPNLLSMLGKADIKTIIAETILTDSQDSYSYKLYPTIEIAKQALKSLPFKIFSYAGIVELEMSVNELALKRKENSQFAIYASAEFYVKNNLNRVSQNIKSFYLKNLHIPATHLKAKECEQEHIAQLDTSILENQQQCLLTCPPELELNKISPALYPMLFIDYMLFDFHLETWKDYDGREPQCVSRFFEAIIKNIFDYLNDPSREKPFITFDDVLEIHQLLSASRFKENEIEHRGHIRTTYNVVPFMKNTVTVSGIKELLVRIKKDNNPLGFMIGEHHRLNLISYFCSYFSTEIVNRTIACNDEHLKLPTVTAEIINTSTFQQAIQPVIEKCFEMAYQKIKNNFDISKEQAKQLVDEFLNSEKPFDKISVDHFYWNSLMYLFDNLTQKYGKISSKSEYEFEIAYSRSHALAAGVAAGVSTDISNYTDDQLQSLAELIYKKLFDGAPMHLLTPHPDLAKQWALKAIDDYNHNISKAKSVLEKIETIDAVTHELEILHIYFDVNLRTCGHLRNKLALANLLRWTILYDPNRTDGYDKAERIKETLLGMARFDFIIKNANELLNKYHLLEEHAENKENDIFNQFNIAKLMAQAQSIGYSEFTKEFNQLLNENERLFVNTVNKLIDQYDKMAQHDNSSIFVRVTDAPRKIVVALKKLLKTKDFIQFNTEMLEISDGWFVKVPLNKVNALFPQLTNNIRTKTQDDQMLISPPLLPSNQGKANVSPTTSPSSPQMK